MTSLRRRHERISEVASDDEDMYSMAPKRSEFQAYSDSAGWITFILLLYWFGCLTIGMAQYEETPERPKHLLYWYDSLLRKYGSIFPYIPLVVRTIGSQVPRLKASWSQDAIGINLVSCWIVYTCVVAARWLVYGVHLHLVPTAFLSDHIILGASIVACAYAELTCAVRDWINLRAKPARALRVCLVLVMILGTSLFLLTATDMYFTARYYHEPLETMFAMLFGAVFQVTASFFCDPSSSAVKAWDNTLE